MKNVCELVLKEQLTSVLHKALQIWIKGKSPEIAKKTGEPADHYMQASKGIPGETKTTREQHNEQ